MGRGRDRGTGWEGVLGGIGYGVRGRVGRDKGTGVGTGTGRGGGIGYGVGKGMGEGIGVRSG